MSQRQQLERIMIIDRAIRSGEYPNADSLAKTIEVSRRVIFNDREFMINRLGAPLEFDRQHGGWYYTNKTWVLPGMIVTEGELLVFFLSVEISRRFLDSSLESSLRSAVEKMALGVRGPVTVDLETLRSHYTFSAPAMISANEQTLIDIHHAICSCQCVWIRYFSPGNNEHTERTILPYHLYNARGDWSVIAFDRLRSDYRNFMVGRIEKWKVLPETFQRDESFSPVERMEDAFLGVLGGKAVDVSIHFRDWSAPYIRERRWHPSQFIEEQEDGSLIMHLKTGGMIQLRSWVLSFGGAAEVLEPDSLRQECMEEIRQMSATYGIG